MRFPWESGSTLSSYYSNKSPVFTQLFAAAAAFNEKNPEINVHSSQASAGNFPYNALKN
jgi:hypothetical protein